MQYGLNDKGQKVEAIQTGERARCPECEKTLIAHCGEIRFPHWQHKTNSSCENWHEPETPWHREWKKKFSKECREVLIENFGEKHRADVKTISGFIIEFQNSPISTAVIAERESFYQNMVWVVNAEPFKKRFKKFSKVTSKLNELDGMIFDQVQDYEREYDKNTEEYSDTLRKVSDEIWNVNNKIGWSERTIKGLRENLDSKDSNEINLTSIDDSTDGIRSTSEEAMPNVDLNPEQGVLYFQRKLKRLGDNKEKKKKWINWIKNLQRIELEGVPYRVVDYEFLNKDNIKWSRVIDNKSIHSMFPEYVQIRSELELLVYGNKVLECTFVMDVSFALKKLDDGIQEIDAQCEEERRNLAQAKEKRKQKLQSDIEKELEKNEDLKKKLIQLCESKERYCMIVERRKADRPQEIEEVKKGIADSFKKQKYKVMQQNKKKFHLDWKNERTTWQFVTKPIYFDTSDGYLYRRIESELLERITIAEFMAILA